MMVGYKEKMMQLTLNTIKLVYLQFGYFLMILLGLGALINGTSEISSWVAFPILLTIVIAELFLMVVVEFNEEGETFTTRFLSRFTKFDVLAVCILTIVYIGGCNNWLNLVY